jgi:hypothetical protein
MPAKLWLNWQYYKSHGMPCDDNKMPQNLLVKLEAAGKNYKI